MQEQICTFETKYRLWSDGARAIGAVSDKPGGARRGSSDAVVAKRAGLRHFGRSEPVDVETRSHVDQLSVIPDAISNEIGYAKFYSRSHDAVIRVYDKAGNVIETHEQAGDFKEW
jgi:hypothetical protein